jgi:hypothetical protein
MHIVYLGVKKRWEEKKAEQYEKNPIIINIGY